MQYLKELKLGKKQNKNLTKRQRMSQNCAVIVHGGRKRDSYTRGHSLQRELIPWEINILKG